MTKLAVVDEPLQTLENGTNHDEKQTIWASILRDVKSSTKKAPATKSLVVLGDNESGRTTLVAKLQGNEDPKRGAGLEYHYIDVKDDDRDDTPKLGVWILDGDVACSAPLLKFAIRPDSLENSILILVASMTQPWSLLSTLQKWTTLVEEHIDRLKLDPTRLREMRDHLQYEFQHYVEPSDSSIMSNSSTTIKNGVGRVTNSVSTNSLTSTTPLSPTTGEGHVVLPLSDGVLTKSLGIQIIVVITKCDVMPVLEKENDYKDEHFDFMQYHLRKFCLEYGAALFYTSVKEKKNIDKLYKYIVHKCYAYPFPYTAAIVDRDAIFIPMGWDNPKKADILLENLHRLKSTDNYSDVFTKSVARRPLQRDNDIITAEDDQEFLAKLQTTLNRASSPAKDEGTKRPPDGNNMHTSSPKQKPSTPTMGDQNRPPNDGTLALFFSNLLSKKQGGSVTPISGGSPIAQRAATQSPTTPSSKRLQQNPLTFTVTPPSARSRTPTSQKSFPSSLNNDTSPKPLSPVVEQQQSKVDERSLTNNELTKAEQDSETRTQNLRSPSPIQNNTDKQEDELLKSTSLQTPVTEVPENNQSILNTNNPLSIESSNSLQENENHVLVDKPNEEQEASLKESQSLLSAANENTEETTENDNKDENVNTFPDLHSQWKQLDQQRSLSVDQQDIQSTEDHKSPISEQLPLSSPKTETNDILSTTLKNQQSIESIELSSSESHAVQTNVDAKSIRSRSSSPVQNKTEERSQSPFLNNQTEEQNQQQSRTSSVDILQEDEPRRQSISSINKQDEQQTEYQRSSTQQAPQRSRSPSPILTQKQDKNRSTSSIQSEDEQQRPSLTTAIDDNKEDDQSISSIVEQRSNNEDDDNVLSVKQENNQTSRSSSPIRDDQEQVQQRTRSPSPVPTEEQVSHRSSSPVLHTDQNERRSRSPSPLTTPNQVPQQVRSPSFTQTEEQELTLQRSRSPSPVPNEEQIQIPQKSRSTSPINTQEKVPERAASPFSAQNAEQEDDQSTLFTNNVEQIPERSRSPSPSPTNNQEKVPERSRSPSPTNNQEQVPERSRSPSPAQNMEYEQTKSSTPTTDPTQVSQRSRSPSPIVQNESQEQTTQRSRSPSPINNQEQALQRSRSLSPRINENEKRSRSSSPTVRNEEQEKNTQRSRSSSPVRTEQQEQSVLTASIQELVPERSRSPSPINNQGQVLERSRSPSPINNQGQVLERSRSPSLVKNTEFEQTESFTPTSNITQVSQRSRSPSPVTNKEQVSERSRSLSPVQQGKRERSQSPVRINDQSEENLEPNSSTTEQQFVNNEDESPVTTQKSERSSSLVPNQEDPEQNSLSAAQLDLHDQDNSLSGEANDHEFETQLPSEAEQRKSPRSSVDVHDDTITNASENLTYPPTNEEETSNTKDANKTSPLVSPSKVSINDNNSNITTDETNRTISSTQRSSLDRAHTLNSSLPSIDRPSSIPRSKSQSTVIRPNTLPFTPNNHDLDGLYTSNDYDDEDELLEDNEYHRNSAPSTVSIERRRSSLFDNNNEQRHVTVDPNDIIKRLSIVKNSTTDGKDNIEADTSISKDT